MPRYRFIVMELSHAGYGSPQTLMDERVDLVLDAYDYLVYRHRFEQQTYLLSKDER